MREGNGKKGGVRACWTIFSERRIESRSSSSNGGCALSTNRIIVRVSLRSHIFEKAVGSE